MDSKANGAQPMAAPIIPAPEAMPPINEAATTAITAPEQSESEAKISGLDESSKKDLPSSEAPENKNEPLPTDLQGKQRVSPTTTEPAKESSDKPEVETKVGDKRDFGNMESSPEKTENSEPLEKKSKPDTEQEQPTATKPTTAQVNGNGNEVKKRGPGRPKRNPTETPDKKPRKVSTPRSTEGIGSRTRSRAQA
ncbi:hypothetical protein FQN57_002430 [Myotisia sp. PD_48]|nr:hypothetical protein FQN57_002430 [Myotisia sp. PD_48]